MTKKFLLLLLLLFLSSCSINKKNLFKLNVNGESIYVGYTKISDITSTFDDIETNEDGVITRLTIYINDYSGPIFVNDYLLNDSIIDNVNGYEWYESNGAYIVEKAISNKVNRMIFYNNILNYDLDKLDHITISFE